MARGAALLLAACALLPLASSLYEPGGSVISASQRSFDKVLKSKVPVVVEFFAPWCGHCKSLAPAFTAAAEKLQGIVPFVAVDCDKESNRPLCSQYGVQGFPTIKLFAPGSSAPQDYNGPRSAKGLADAAVGMLSNKHVKQLKSQASALAWIQQHPGTKVVLVTDKPKTPPLYKSLSQRFTSQGIRFAEVVVSEETRPQLAALGVSKTPALLALKGTDLSQRTLYEGDLKAPRIMDWLKQLAQGIEASGRQEAVGGEADGGAGAQGKAGEGESKESKESKKAGGKKEEQSVAEIPQVVANVSAAELARRLEKEGVVIVSFFAGPEAACREHLNQLNAAVHGLQRLATGVQVDLTSAKEAAAVNDLYSLTLPALGDTSCATKTFLLPFDPEEHEDVDEWRAYEGPLSSKDLHKAALELFPAAGISAVTSGTHRQWLGADVGRVKVLLFTDKADPPALFRALSCNFRPFQFDFGVVPSTEAEVMKAFAVQKVPTIVISFARPGPDGKPPPPGAKDVQFGVQPYQGPLKYGHIAGWLTMVGLQTGTAPADTLGQFGGGKRADAMVAQITDQESWDASCLTKGGVCIVAALSGGDEQAAQLEVLRSAAAGRADQPVHFCYYVAGGGAQGFAAELGLDGGQAPALVAVAPKKQRSAVMTARFQTDSVKEWLDGLLSGKVRTAPLQQLPAWPAGGGAAGAAGEAAAEEDEFDLSDIMSEEIEGDVSKKGAVRDEL